MIYLLFTGHINAPVVVKFEFLLLLLFITRSKISSVLVDKVFKKFFAFFVEDFLQNFKNILVKIFL